MVFSDRLRVVDVVDLRRRATFGAGNELSRRVCSDGYLQPCGHGMAEGYEESHIGWRIFDFGGIYLLRSSHVLGWTRAVHRFSGDDRTGHSFYGAGLDPAE